MSSPRYPLWTPALCLALSAGALGACGSSKKSDPPAAAPKEEVRVNVVGTDSSGATTKVRYQATVNGAVVTDASFKCQTEMSGKVSDWQACPADGAAISAQGGLTIFRVKAVSSKGVESSAYELQLSGAGGGGAGPGAGPTTGGGAPSPSALATQILNKGDVASGTYARSDLTLHLGVKGDGVSIDKVVFECKRETDADFHRCDANNQPQYVFSQMIDSAKYALSVRARIPDQNLIAAEDSLGFTVALAKVPIANAADLSKAGSTDVALTVDRAALPNARLLCSMDAAAPTDCATGASGSILVQRNLLAPGSHTLKIVADANTGAQLGASTINFCMGECTAPAGPTQPIVKAFQVGSFYSYLVPDDLHVTEYATTKTYNGVLNFFRIMPESDPFYLGIYRCDGEFDQRMTAARPDGKGYYDYCQSTPQRDLYKWLTDYRLAENHLEVATNTELVLASNDPRLGVTNHDKIQINVFDEQWEFSVQKSRFDQLCGNVRGTITQSPPIRVIDRNFWGEKVTAEVYSCVTRIAGIGPGSFPVSNDEWWVGAFFIHSESLNLPLYECYTQKDSAPGTYDASYGYGPGYDTKYSPTFCGTFHNPHVIEVVMMSKTPFRTPADFDQALQTRFVRNLFEITPSK